MKALKQSFEVRKSDCLKKLVHHSDRGSQYVSKNYTNLLIEKNIPISMGYTALENAFAERINGTIKNEFLRKWEIKNFKELKRKLKYAVHYYNQGSIHNFVYEW